MKKNFKRLFLLMAVVMTVMMCFAFSVSAKTYCIEASPEVNAKALEYINEIYIKNYPEFGLEFPFGSEGDKKVLKSAADKITKGAKTDKEKVDLIIKWINRNIDYRSYTTGSGHIYAIDTYYYKSGNCVGISQLILNFCRLSGIKAVMCCGPRGNMENELTLESKEPDHAWTMIYLDGEWYLYDPLFDVYGTKNKKFINKWYFFDIIEGVSPYVKKYAKNIFTGDCIFYIDGRFMHYINGVPANKYRDNAADGGYSINLCMPFFAINRYSVDGIEDGHEYLKNPKRKDSMITDECYTNGWVTYGGDSLQYVKPNGIKTGARIMDYGGQCLYFSYMSSAVILPGKSKDYTCTDGYLTMYEGQKLSVSYTWQENELSQGRKMVYEAINPEYATIDKNGVITAVSEGLATFYARAVNKEGTHRSSSLFQIYVIPKKRTVKYAFCNEYSEDKEHSYKTITTQATNGNVKYECKNCGYVKSDNIVNAPKTIKLSKTVYTYNGKIQKPSVIVKDDKGNKLVKDTDYTVKYENSSSKTPGEYTVTIIFKGKYSGTKKLTYKIAPKVTSKISASQTTTTITLKWGKVTGATGYRVYKYNSNTKKYEKLKDVKETSLKISSLKASSKHKYKIRAYKKGDVVIWGGYSEAFETATKSKTPELKVTSSKKGAAALSWTNVSGESGYQVYYATKKSGDYKKLASYKKDVVKGSNSKLKSGKTYYFKVRAYTKTESGTVYSAWSSVKSVKIK